MNYVQIPGLGLTFVQCESYNKFLIMFTGDRSVLETQS